MARLSGLSYGFIDSRNLEKQIWTTLGLENCCLKTWTLGKKTFGPTKQAAEKMRRLDFREFLEELPVAPCVFED